MKRIPLLVAVLAAGCVSTSTFKAQQKATDDAKALSVSLVSQLNATQGRLAAAAKDRDATKAQLAETTSKLAAANDQVESLKKSVADLQQSLEANRGELKGKIVELVKEKDALAQRLSASEQAAAELRTTSDSLSSQLKDGQARLADLEKAKAALEDEKAALQKQKDDELAATKKSYEDMVSGLKAEVQSGAVTISNLKGKLTVNMVDRILFDSGSAEVKPAGRKVLAKVGEALNAVKDKDIRIEGHTDNVPISAELAGRYASNWELSTARATAVARYLQDQAQVDPKRLVAAGYGEWRPVAPNDTPENRALNRRIEIVLVPQD